ncbi:NAD(P)-binding domain-containing protein [Caballeronia sp. INDeC2]|uniref:NADPH-dependent F420 reductase n=1 Tax=Caballeronia sp. INDeC2 TaxID=2921747 RepID=UPI002029682D|nr:NAD(P)-binding domain-containing protein [Caballeronia sp. INDeC2]
MKIGIIGAGYIGRSLATLGIRQGHEVMISNSRGPATLGSTVSAIGCKAGTAEQAAVFGDIVVLAVPLRGISNVPAGPFAGKILIDTCNYYPERDGRIEALDRHETTTSQLVATRFPGARVVKAFNAILAKDIETTGQAAGTPNRRALPIAGDDADSKRVVAAWLDECGYDAFDAGRLADSWRFERAKPAYCIPLDQPSLKTKLAMAERDVELPHGSWRR